MNKNMFRVRFKNEVFPSCSLSLCGEKK